MPGRRQASILVALCILPILAFALEWPVSGGYPAIPFGSFHTGRFVTEMSVASSEVQVRASESGDVAFAFDGDKLPSGLPCPLGGFVALSHADGLISVYGRLERGSLPSYFRSVAAGDVLGRVGGSGFYSSREASFTLYDRVKHQYLNPQTLLPVIRDSNAPMVRAIYLISGEKAFTLGESRSVRQGTYEVLLDVQDPPPVPDARPRAPYSLRLLIDGTERVRYVYDIAKAEGGKLRFFGAAKVESGSFYREDGIVRLGSFLLSHGRSTVVVIVSDYAGNAREIANTVVIE